VARLAYALAMLINPNNHSLDGGRASSAMEKEAVGELAAMLGWSSHLGHLTGGGTLANLEALWIASRLAPGQVVLASAEAHYTHGRLSDMLGLAFEAVAVDAGGRLDLEALEVRLRGGGVGTVVATVGTTGLGAVDPVAELVALRSRYGFRLHVDAAYGGYFGLTSVLDAESRTAFDALAQVDSVVVDPHKHGLQPYGCGAVLYRDPSVGRFYRHDSPYTYFTGADLHLGEISLECSRAGAAAAALWATQRLLPLQTDGTFAADLARCLRAARELHRRLQADPRFLTLLPPALDIVVWAPAAEGAAQVSAASRRLFDAAARRNLHLALVRVDAPLLARHWPGVVSSNAEPVTCLRCCLMKPEHLDWLDDLWAALDGALEETG
jgi:glutamate/tyrosine decarboxylase-like PLP-dependent enzyme